MQAKYLDLLSTTVQKLIFDVEKAAGVEIKVIPDINQNEGGTTGKGNLAINIKAHSIPLFAPTNGYFPDGAVLHEVLHVKRFLVEGIPKLVLSDNVKWNKSFADGLCNLDNSIEHVFIVPVELELHPERHLHWEEVMRNVCLELSYIPESERPIAICMHWTFIQNVLPKSPSTESLRRFAEAHNLLAMANKFAEQFMSVAASKEKLVSLIFHTFPEIPKSHAALEYINSCSGTIQRPIQ